MKSLRIVTNKEEERVFRELLRQIKAGEKLVDELFENPVYVRLGKAICTVLTRNTQDAEDLYQVVSLKVAEKILDKFIPDYSVEYGKFFAWFRTITRNARIDQLRETTQPSFDPTPVEELFNLRARGANPEVLSMRGELFSYVAGLPKIQRWAIQLFLRGYSLRESQEALAKLGIHRSHTAIRRMVSKGLEPFCSYAEVIKTLSDWESEQKGSARPGNDSNKSVSDKRELVI